MNPLPLVFFWSLWFLNFSSRTVLSPLLPLIEENLRLSHGQAGGLFTSLYIGYGLSLLIAGRFASVWGCKRVVIASCVGIGFVFVLIQWADRYLALHGVFFLLGLAAGSFSPAMIPIISETYASRHWGKVIGIYDSAASSSVFAVPLLVTFGLHFLPWKTLLLVLAVAAFLLPIGFGKIAIEPKPTASFQRGYTLNLLKRKSVWVMAVLWVAASASYSGLFSILPLFLIKERGLSFDYANTLIGISRASGIFVSIASGFLVDRYGYSRVMAFSLLSTGLSTIGIALAPNPTVLMIALIVQATLSNVFFPAGLAAIPHLNPSSDRSAATGLILFFGVILGNGISPLLLGVTADHISFHIGILGFGILISVSPLVLRFLHKA
jgi:NNP family nitrate/nitrite transporter-like MFS transporter